MPGQPNSNFEVVWGYTIFSWEKSKTDLSCFFRLKIKIRVAKMMTLMEKINLGIKDALRAQDPIRLNTLRMLKSKILAVDARGNLSDSEVLKLFKTYYSNLLEAKEQSCGREDIVAQLEKEIKIVQEFLPKALSTEETQKIVEQAIVDSGAKTKKDLGLVMKSIMKINNSVDGKLAKELANQLLAD